MQTERLKRLRAWAGGCGVSARMAASARSSQTRATLLEAAAYRLRWAAKRRHNDQMARRISLAGWSDILNRGDFITVEGWVVGFSVPQKEISAHRPPGPTVSW